MLPSRRCSVQVVVGKEMDGKGKASGAVMVTGRGQHLFQCFVDQFPTVWLRCDGYRALYLASIISRSIVHFALRCVCVVWTVQMTKLGDSSFGFDSIFFCNVLAFFIDCVFILNHLLLIGYPVLFLFVFTISSVLKCQFCTLF